jgi:hypothetical protein
MILKSEIDLWFKNEAKVRAFVRGLELVQDSGVLDILRRSGTPIVGNDGGDVNKMAGKAFWNCGYQEAIHRLQHFMAIFGYESEVMGELKAPDYGAVDELVRSKIISKEEADQAGYGVSTVK